MGNCDINGEEEVDLRMRRIVVACVNYNDSDHESKMFCPSSLPICRGAIVPNKQVVAHHSPVADARLQYA